MVYYCLSYEWKETSAGFGFYRRLLDIGEFQVFTVPYFNVFLRYLRNTGIE